MKVCSHASDSHTCGLFSIVQNIRSGELMVCNNFPCCTVNNICDDFFSQTNANNFLPMTLSNYRKTRPPLDKSEVRKMFRKMLKGPKDERSKKSGRKTN